MAKRKQTTTFIFEQQLKGEYWDWSDEKKALFEDWKSNKQEIFQEIYNRVKVLETDSSLKIALIVHDKDKTFGNNLVFPHLHGYIEFSNKRDLSVLALNLGLYPQYIEPSGRGKYGKINSKAYLIHAKSPDKYQYQPSEVETFGTFDYERFIQENLDSFTKQSAKVKREQSDESLDMIFQEIIKGKLTEDDIFADEKLTFLWAYNQQKFDEAFKAYGKISAKTTLRQLENGEFKPTILYIHGQSGIGKTSLAYDLVAEIVLQAEKQDLNWKTYNAGSKNIFDEYFGEEIIVLDDPRYDSLLPSDWLKLLDPLNKSYLSARYRNKLVIGRVIVITNYMSLSEFFRQIPKEDINQYLRRFNNVIEITKSGNDRQYNLSEIRELSVPNSDGYKFLNFQEFEVMSSTDKKEFLDKILEEYIYPRILPDKQKIQLVKNESDCKK